MFARFKKIYDEFPRLFWIVVAVSFIDGIGGTILWPFFALYITQKFGVGMTEAGVLLGMNSLFGLIGGMIGGALTDKFGRKQLIMFGLVLSAVSTLSFGLARNIQTMYFLVIVVGLLVRIAGPAHEAMIADILPERKRQEGFGILRVVGNFAWIIGPTIGGFLANINFFYLFVIDTIMSCAVAVIVYRLIPETKPEPRAHEKSESFLKTVAGYRVAVRDSAFISFIVANILMLLVYQQMYGTLSVYLNKVHQIGPQGYGLIMTTSAITVVLFQFWLTRTIKHRPPFLLMAVGTMFYAIGFFLYGIVATFILFLLNMVIITIGEMIVVPTSQALVAGFAPDQMRGRYMAIASLSWAIPSTIGPGAAGYILDHYNPNLVWYLGGALCGFSVLAYYALHVRLGRRREFAPASEDPLPLAASTD